MIHHTALVAEGAEVASDAEIGPFCVLGNKVRIGSGTRIGGHSVIDGNVEIGEGCFLGSHVSIGLPPQDKEYQGEDTCVRIGNGVTIREFATVNLGTPQGTGVTSIGDNCFLMAYTHVGHDCSVEEEVIMANNATLGGHVTVQRQANISAMFMVHQHVVVGELSMLSAISGTRKCVPPYIIAEGRPTRIWRVNSVGLKRAGKLTDTIKAIDWAYRQIRSLEISKATREISERGEAENVPELIKIADFYRHTKRGVISFHRHGVDDQD